MLASFDGKDVTMKFRGQDEMILSQETITLMLTEWLNDARYQGEQVDLVSWSQLRGKRMKIVFKPRPLPVRAAAPKAAVTS
jgi:hypothetical protein